MRPLRCPSPAAVGSSFEGPFTDLEIYFLKKKIPFSNGSRQDWFGCWAVLGKFTPCQGFSSWIWLLPLQPALPGSASSSGISNTGIFVVISPYFIWPCSAELGTRWPRGFLAGGWRAVIPLGTVCLSVCQFYLYFKQAQLCLGWEICLCFSGIHIHRGIPSLGSSCPGFPDFPIYFSKLGSSLS